MNEATWKRLAYYTGVTGIPQITKRTAAEFYARASAYTTAHNAEPLTIQEIRDNIGFNAETDSPGTFRPLTRMQYRQAMKDSGHKVEVSELARLKAEYEISAPEACHK